MEGVDGSGLIDKDSTFMFAAIGPETKTTPANWGQLNSWTWIVFVFNPTHQDWFQIRNLQLEYVVPSGGSQSDVVIDQVKLEVIRYDDF